MQWQTQQLKEELNGANFVLTHYQSLLQPIIRPQATQSVYFTSFLCALKEGGLKVPIKFRFPSKTFDIPE